MIKTKMKSNINLHLSQKGRGGEGSREGRNILLRDCDTCENMASQHGPYVSVKSCIADEFFVIWNISILQTNMNTQKKLFRVYLSPWSFLREEFTLSSGSTIFWSYKSIIKTIKTAIIILLLINKKSNILFLGLKKIALLMTNATCIEVVKVLDRGHILLYDNPPPRIFQLQHIIHPPYIQFKFIKLTILYKRELLLKLEWNS